MIFQIFLIICTIFNYCLFIDVNVGEPVLEAIQARPSFLLCCYENFCRAGLSSCIFVRTFHAIIFSQGMLHILHSAHHIQKYLPNRYLKMFSSWLNDSTFFLTLKVLKQLNLPPDSTLSLSDEAGDLEKARKPWEVLPDGHKIGTPEPLFKEMVFVWYSSSH